MKDAAPAPPANPSTPLDAAGAFPSVTDGSPAEFPALARLVASTDESAPVTVVAMIPIEEESAHETVTVIEAGEAPAAAHHKRCLTRGSEPPCATSEIDAQVSPTLSVMVGEAGLLVAFLAIQHAKIIESAAGVKLPVTAEVVPPVGVATFAGVPIATA